MTKLATPLKKRELVETFMREAILAAAKKVLAANTYDRTSLDQIAQEAQVSKGSIYVYFHGKEDLLWEVLKESLQRFIEAGKAAAAQAQAGQLIYLEVQRQSLLMAFLDDFWLIGMVSLVCVPLVFLTRRFTGGMAVGH